MHLGQTDSNCNSSFGMFSLHSRSSNTHVLPQRTWSACRWASSLRQLYHLTSQFPLLCQEKLAAFRVHTLSRKVFAQSWGVTLLVTHANCCIPGKKQQLVTARRQGILWFLWVCRTSFRLVLHALLSSTFWPWIFMFFMFSLGTCQSLSYAPQQEVLSRRLSHLKSSCCFSMSLQPNAVQPSYQRRSQAIAFHRHSGWNQSGTTDSETHSRLRI